MPAQEFGVGTIPRVAWHIHRLPVERIVGVAVVILIPKSAADFCPHVRRDREVAFVEQPVQVRSEENAVANLVRTALAERKDVTGLEDRQRMLTGDRAAPVVGVSDSNAERLLAKSRTDERGCTVPRRRLEQEG